MKWIVARIRWIMLVSGALTCTMLFAAIAPEAALRATFGEALQGPLAEIIVRNWGLLVALVGGGLIYGANHPPSRRLILTMAAAGKLFFVALVLIYGRPYLHKAALVLLSDLTMSALFLGYLLDGERGTGRA